MTLTEMAAGTPEADAMARKILGSLYELAAAAQGARLGEIQITKQSAPTAADRESALLRGKPRTSFGDANSIAHPEAGRKGASAWA